MNPQEYESYVAEVYAEEGYKTTVTPYAGDGGIDVIAEKDGKRVAIQCKNYGHTTRSINADMIRTLYGAAVEQGFDEAHMVTDGDLLPDAEKTAAKLGVRIRYILTDVSNLFQGCKQINNIDGLFENTTKITDIAQISNIQEDIDTLSNNISGKIDDSIIETLKTLPSFDEVWEKIKALVGEKIYLLKQNNKFNIITKVDNAGLKRISKNGKPSKKIVPIEAFRFTYNKLIQNTEVTRDEINQEFPERCSSIVIAVLARVMPVNTIDEPLRLKLKI